MPSYERLYLPAHLVIRLRVRGGAPAVGVAVRLTLLARTRSDYELVPALSDASGAINVDRAWAERAVRSLQSAFIMDYNTPVDFCLPRVHIEILSPEQVAKECRLLEEFKWARLKNVAPTVEQLASAENRRYRPKVVCFRLDSPDEGTREVTITLLRTGVLGSLADGLAGLLRGDVVAGASHT